MIETRRMANSEYPPVESFSNLLFAEREYLALPAEGDLREWLNRRATEGWRLIAVDGGLHYFEREEYCMYHDDENGKLVRRAVGENS